MGGRNKWNTMCGSLFSVAIVLVSAAFGFYQFRKATAGTVIPQIQIYEQPNFFQDTTPIR